MFSSWQRYSLFDNVIGFGVRLYRKTSLNKPNNIIPQKFDLHRPEISVQVYTQEQYEAAKELEIEHIYYKNFIHILADSLLVILACVDTCNSKFVYSLTK